MGQSEMVIEGLVLCRVGADRIAVRAHDVTAFEAAAEGVLYAGTGFHSDARPPPDAKLIRHRTSAVVVDAVEVHAERLQLLAVPQVLAQAWGGALAGFVETGGMLWPVLSLERLAGLGGAPSEEAGSGAGPAERWTTAAGGRAATNKNRGSP